MHPDGAVGEKRQRAGGSEVQTVNDVAVSGAQSRDKLVQPAWAVGRGHNLGVTLLLTRARRSGWSKTSIAVPAARSLRRPRRAS